MTNDPELTTPSPEDDLAEVVHARVAEILADARAQAHALQAEVETAAANRAIEVRLQAEDDAAAMRAEAQEEVAAIRARALADAATYLEDARARIDAFAQERTRRLGELADDLADRAAGLQTRLDESLSVKDELDRVVASLRHAAQEAVAEVARPPQSLPRIGEAPRPAGGGTVAAVPEPDATSAASAPSAALAPVPAPAPPAPRADQPAAARPLRQEADAVRTRVRDAARALPERPVVADAAPRQVIPVRPPHPKDGA